MPGRRPVFDYADFGEQIGMLEAEANSSPTFPATIEVAVLMPDGDGPAIMLRRGQGSTDILVYASPDDRSPQSFEDNPTGAYLLFMRLVETKLRERFRMPPGRGRF